MNPPSAMLRLAGALSVLVLVVVSNSFGESDALNVSKVSPTVSDVAICAPAEFEGNDIGAGGDVEIGE